MRLLLILSACLLVGCGPSQKEVELQSQLDELKDDMKKLSAKKEQQPSEKKQQKGDNVDIDMEEFIEKELEKAKKRLKEKDTSKEDVAWLIRSAAKAQIRNVAFEILNALKKKDAITASQFFSSEQKQKFNELVSKGEASEFKLLNGWRTDVMKKWDGKKDLLEILYNGEDQALVKFLEIKEEVFVLLIILEGEWVLDDMRFSNKSEWMDWKKKKMRKN